LQHSRHRIVTISIVLFVLAVIAFFSYTLLALYRFHTTSTFMYRVTQVIPFPVAKAGPSWVAYENYLFEVRRYKHYYQTQQEVDFSSKAGKSQLADFQNRALDNVIDDAYIKQLAKENGVTVGRGEVNEQIALLRSQNRLGGSDQVFEDVLKEYWGWSVDDFRRVLQQQLLAQKVVSKLDTEAHDRAKGYASQLQGGADFAELAKQHSDDEATKANGGEYGFTIERSNRDLQPKAIDELFKLQPGQTSGVIETPTGLEIVKVIENTNGKIRAAHIVVNFKPVSAYIDSVKDEKKPRRFLGL
jgi:coenzyme F420-reducing hydrogenase alpha subunit